MGYDMTHMRIIDITSVISRIESGEFEKHDVSFISDSFNERYVSRKSIDDQLAWCDEIKTDTDENHYVEDHWIRLSEFEKYTISHAQPMDIWKVDLIRSFDQIAWTLDKVCSKNEKGKTCIYGAIYPLEVNTKMGKEIIKGTQGHPLGISNSNQCKAISSFLNSVSDDVFRKFFIYETMATDGIYKTFPKMPDDRIESAREQCIDILKKLRAFYAQIALAGHSALVSVD